jgi:hypothetical protein
VLIFRAKNPGEMRLRREIGFVARAASAMLIVAHYKWVRKLGLTAEQQRELVEYLKSL